MTTPAQTPASAPTGQDGAAAPGTTPAAAGAETPTTPTTPADGTAAPGTTPADGAPAPASALGGAAVDGTTGGQGQPSGDPAAAGAELTVTLPEGVTVDQVMLDSFKPVAVKLGLDSEKASELAGWYAEHQAAMEKSQADAQVQQSADWLKSLQDDVEFGGTNFTGNVAAAQRGITMAGGVPLRQALVEVGLDCWPPLVRAFARVGNAIKEDTVGGGAPGGAIPPATKEAELKTHYDKSQ